MSNELSLRYGHVIWVSGYPALTDHNMDVQYQRSTQETKAACLCQAISIGNHTVFLVQFEINLHLWVFQKAKLHSPKRLVQSQFFEKLTRANWFQFERENRMITY